MVDPAAVPETLGALGAYEKDERDDYYERRICTPTPTDSGEQLHRSHVLRTVFNAFGYPKTVLDLGCHDGFSTRWLMKDTYPEVETIVGIDLCKEAIAHARRFRDLEFPDKNIFYHRTDVFERLRNEDATWDAIVCFEFIEHFFLAEIEELIELIHKRLAPGGWAFISTPFVHGRYGKSNPDSEHITLFDELLLENVIENKLFLPANVFTDATGTTLYAIWEKKAD